MKQILRVKTMSISRKELQDLNSSQFTVKYFNFFAIENVFDMFSKKF
jgi:hypothetical protein